VTFGDVFATVYRDRGADVRAATIGEPGGRPRHPIEDGARPVREPS
jgi:hypothetical protein